MVLLVAASRVQYRAKEWHYRLCRVRRIKTRSWMDKEYTINEFKLLSSFHMTKADFPKAVHAVSWIREKTATARSEYNKLPELTTLIILCCLVSPCRWVDVVHTFKKHPSHMNEVFWRGLQRLMTKWKHILCRDVDKEFIAEKTAAYVTEIESKCGMLRGRIGFMKGNVIGIARPVISAEQKTLYNEHKCKNALKFQTVTSLDGLIIQVAKPLKGRRHEGQCM